MNPSSLTRTTHVTTSFPVVFPVCLPPAHAWHHTHAVPHMYDDSCTHDNKSVQSTEPPSQHPRTAEARTTSGVLCLTPACTPIRLSFKEAKVVWYCLISLTCLPGRVVCRTGALEPSLALSMQPVSLCLSSRPLRISCSSSRSAVNAASVLFLIFVYFSFIVIEFFIVLLRHHVFVSLSCHHFIRLLVINHHTYLPLSSVITYFILSFVRYAIVSF